MAYMTFTVSFFLFSALPFLFVHVCVLLLQVWGENREGGLLPHQHAASSKRERRVGLRRLQLLCSQLTRGRQGGHPACQHKYSIRIHFYPFCVCVRVSPCDWEAVLCWYSVKNLAAPKNTHFSWAGKRNPSTSLKYDFFSLRSSCASLKGTLIITIWSSTKKVLLKCVFDTLSVTTHKRSRQMSYRKYTGMKQK